MSVQPIPEGYNAVMPYLLVDGVDRWLEFVCAAFGAVVIEKVPGADGRTTHAEVRIRESVVMAGQARPEHPAQATMLYHYVPDVDSVYAKALTAGGESVQELTNTFYGDRTAAIKDPGGHTWYLATHVEDVSHEEMTRRNAERE